ncbi:MAG: transketolase C-terminal domain-containing protein, partial [Planctomycetota bacterium]
DTHGAHGAPLGDDEIKLTKQAYGWPEDEKFLVPDGVQEHFQETLGNRGAAASSAWQELYEKYKGEFPAEAKQLDAFIAGELPEDWDSGIEAFPTDEKGMATRASSGKVLNMLAPNFPWLVGGSADLAPSTNTLLKESGDFASASYDGRNMHFGIREHGMAAALNGMSLSGIRAYGATFFVFTDYLRPSMRLSSLMHQPVLYVMTHDSIGLGEDGPTHQPVEHLAACRGIPGLYVFRPGDANEVAEAYRAALGMNDHPSVMVLSRQAVPTLDREALSPAAGTAKGGYVLSDCDGTPDVVIMGTGTELSLCLKAQAELASSGIKARVVSMPCMELFDEQLPEYQESVLPADCKVRIACEAGIRQCWDKYLGTTGHFVGMSSFGASAPAGQLYEHFKITSDQIVSVAKVAMQ